MSLTGESSWPRGKSWTLPSKVQTKILPGNDIKQLLTYPWWANFCLPQSGWRECSSWPSAPVSQPSQLGGIRSTNRWWCGEHGRTSQQHSSFQSNSWHNWRARTHAHTHRRSRAGQYRQIYPRTTRSVRVQTASEIRVARLERNPLSLITHPFHPLHFNISPSAQTDPYKRTQNHRTSKKKKTEIDQLVTKRIKINTSIWQPWRRVWQSLQLRPLRRSDVYLFSFRVP